MNDSNILIYQTEDGKTKIETRLEDESVWLTIDQMAQLFQKSRSTINEHIIHIFEEQELDHSQSVRKIGISDFSTKPTNYYNLDVIISVGYRVKSPPAGLNLRLSPNRLSNLQIASSRHLKMPEPLRTKSEDFAQPGMVGLPKIYTEKLLPLIS